MANFDHYERTRRSYEHKKTTKAGALLFGAGFGATLAIMAIILGLLVPYLGPKLDSLVYHARTTYRRLLPHPEYLPTPAPVVQQAAQRPEQLERIEPILPEVPATRQPAPTATPAAQADLLLPPVVSPAATPTAVPSPTTPPVEPAPLPERVQLDGIIHQWQTWNNCGPATVTMNMSYFGRSETQAEAALFLKPNRDDKNVSPHEIAAYVRETTGLEALVRRGGSIDQLKQLLSYDLPVLAGTWLVHDGDGLGHYRLLIGYDDTTGQFDTFDSLNGPNFKVSYQQFDEDWRVFNRVYVILFPPEQAQIVESILGEGKDDTAMYQQLLATARSDTSASPNDAIAYFNQGEALTYLGQYDEAVTAFDQARQLGLHWRRLWYQFTPFEAYYAIGRYQDVLDLATATIKTTGGLEEAYYYHGLALHATGQPGAEKDFQAALDYNPNFKPAAEALAQLTAR